MANKKLITVEGISKHSSPESCWIVVEGNVWDMTEYIPQHPGGPAIILKHAGLDATSAYSEIHASSVIKENLPSSKLIGKLDTSTVTEEWSKQPSDEKTKVKPGEKPPIATIINAFDFERLAQQTLPEKTWAFYSSGATDCVTRDANHGFFDRVWWRPRILKNVRKIETRSKILGHKVDLPLFISPAAMAKMIHPEGEKAMARGCVASQIIQCISTNASFTVSEIVSETPEDYPTFFQLYVNSNRKKTVELISKIMGLRPRIKAIFLTVDAAVPGKREPDERLKADETLSAPNSEQAAKNDAIGGGLGRIMGSFIDAGLAWEDLKWIREQIGDDMPLVLKGIQSATDAKLAMEAGMQGIVVSNHGGRSLDTAPPVLLILLDIHKNCPEVFEKMEVYVDGGIRRGTDIIKCMCLGVTAVGIGRHFLYSLNYGQEGVEHLVKLLKDEMETTMRLIGITDLSQAHPDLVNTADLDYLVPASDRHPYITRRWNPKARI